MGGSKKIISYRMDPCPPLWEILSIVVNVAQSLCTNVLFKLLIQSINHSGPSSEPCGTKLDFWCLIIIAAYCCSLVSQIAFKLLMRRQINENSTSPSTCKCIFVGIFYNGYIASLASQSFSQLPTVRHQITMHFQLDCMQDQLATVQHDPKSFQSKKLS